MVFNLINKLQSYPLRDYVIHSNVHGPYFKDSLVLLSPMNKENNGHYSGVMAKDLKRR